MTDREDYLNELQRWAGVLAKQIRDAESAKGDERRALELFAAQTACEAAGWLLESPQFRRDLESLPEDVEETRDGLAELARSADEFDKFLNAESAFLLGRKVPKRVVEALMHECQDLRSNLLDGAQPSELLSRLATLRDLACQEHRAAMEGVRARPGRLLGLAKRVFLGLGGGLVVAFNKLGGLAVVVQTLGAGAPAVVIADAMSSALGLGMIKKAVLD